MSFWSFLSLVLLPIAATCGGVAAHLLFLVLLLLLMLIRLGPLLLLHVAAFVVVDHATGVTPSLPVARFICHRSGSLDARSSVIHLPGSVSTIALGPNGQSS